MKYLFLSFLLFSAFNSKSYAYGDIQLVDSGGEIRFGSLTDEATFVSFYEYLMIEIARKGLQVTHQNKDVKISYDFDLDRNTFYHLFPKAVMTIKIKKDALTVTESFKCSPEINDGGNVTIKERCAKKTAKKIVSLYKSEGF